MTVEADGFVRKRAARLDVSLSRQAMLAVRPARLRLNAWQSRLAYLRALAQRRGSAGEPVDAILDEAVAILNEIEAHRQQLDISGAALPDSVRRHSRFQDVVRALGTASTAARAMAPASRT